MSKKIAIGVCAGLLVLSGAGSGYAAAKLPKGSVGGVQLKKDAVTAAKVKDGSLVAADLSAEAQAALRGAAGPAGPAGPKGAVGAAGAAGAPGPSTSVAAGTTSSTPLTSSPITVITLNANGPSRIPAAQPSQLVVHASLSIGNSANSGVASTVRCRLLVDGGGGFESFGPEMLVTSPGNTAFDEQVSMSLVGAVNVPVGIYDAGVTCTEVFESGASAPVLRTASLVAVLTGRGPTA